MYFEFVFILLAKVHHLFCCFITRPITKSQQEAEQRQALQSHWTIAAAGLGHFILLVSISEGVYKAVSLSYKHDLKFWIWPNTFL